MIVGYARVSTEDQKLDLQIQALERAGCDLIYKDHGQSGAHFLRSGLESALGHLSQGGTLVVWRLDRLGRSLSGLVQLMEQLGRRRIDFRSICENIDTASSGGRLMFHMMAALAEFERSLVSERTRAGMAAAKARGQRLGRPRALTEDQIHHAKCAHDCFKRELEGIAAEFNVSKRTLLRHMTDCGPLHSACNRPCCARQRPGNPIDA